MKRLPDGGTYLTNHGEVAAEVRRFYECGDTRLLVVGDSPRAAATVATLFKECSRRGLSPDIMRFARLDIRRPGEKVVNIAVVSFDRAAFTDAGFVALCRVAGQPAELACGPADVAVWAATPQDVALIVDMIEQCRAGDAGTFDPRVN